MNDRYDVIIIGSGAGGSTLAHRLAGSGKRIAVLERGRFIPRERENWDPAAVFEQRRYQAQETWTDQHDRPFRPYTHYCVGGNTKVYGAALLRMRRHDFGPVRHHGGISPAWPISYDDLEPFYCEAERLYSVHGSRGADPTEPPASEPFPHPPLPAEPRIAQLFEDLHAVGLRPFPIPLGVRLEPRYRAEAPVHLSAFDGYPDPTETKADAHVSALRPAMSRHSVELLTGARALRLDTDPSGRAVRSVLVERDGRTMSLHADLFVLACGAINSAALLLRSASDNHPDGLANASGLVGRNYMCHQNGCLIAVTDSPNPSAFQKHFGITDFYERDPADPDFPFPLGLVQLMGKPDRATLAWLRADALPTLSLDDIAARTVDFFLTAEDLPDPDNRVEVRPDGGIRIRYQPNNTQAYERLRLRFTQALDAADRRRGLAPATYLHQRLDVSGVSHQNGTLRFGHDPADSVLDVHCKAHDLDNLYAVDASFFPSSAAVNPSLTIIANALRIGDHLLERLGATARTAVRSPALRSPS